MRDPDHLTRDEVASVLRRAAELDRSDGPDLADGIPIDAVESAAAEAGLSGEHVRQAVAELRAGMIGNGTGATTAVAPGRGTVVAAAVVPWAPAEALDAIDEFVTSKALERVRDQGDARIYRRRRDLAASLNRAVDLGRGTRKLQSVETIEVRTVEVADGTLVRLVAELDRGVAHAPPITAGVAGVTTGIGAGIGLAFGIDPSVVGAALGVPVGAAFGAGGWMVAGAVVDRHRRRLAEVLNGLLDELMQGRRPVAPSALDKLRDHLPSLRGITGRGSRPRPDGGHQA